ncbi:hypothetical protein MMC30_002932 [Trapelia coarctata]|nr:hypothetical protein [Trapelia coarctata]
MAMEHPAEEQTSAPSTALPSTSTSVSNDHLSQKPAAKEYPLVEEKETVKDVEHAAVEDDETANHLSGPKLYLVILGLSLSILLMALDTAVLATAIPTITSDFNSLGDVGWYGSAFLFTICACQPLAGKIFQLFSLKWSFLGFLALFEVGSLICATSPSSVALIIGRAIAGIGAAGLFPGSLIIVAHISPRNMRPAYTGILTSTFGLSSVIGPIIGGAFTQHVTWRWCFYINLPLGAVTFGTILLFFHPSAREVSQLTIVDKLKRLDLPGFALFSPAVIMLLLALQWAGHTYAWNSATVIGLLCGFAGLILIFMAWQWRQQDEASIPPGTFLQRTVFCGALTTFLSMGAPVVATYFLPIWFQVILAASPTNSGVMYLPTVIANVLISIAGGILVTKFGYYNPGLLLGLVFTSVGSGLLSTLQTDSGRAAWIGYQILCGFGFGLIVQMPLIAVQAALPLAKVPTGTTIMVFFQFLSGSVFLAIAQAIFQSRLLAELALQAPTENAAAILAAGAENMRTTVGAGNLGGVLEAYNVAVTDTFFAPAAGAALAFFAAVGMQWISVKGKTLV